MRHLVGPGFAIILALACGREVVFVDPPPTSGGDTGSDTSGTDTTTVQRVDLVVTVQVAAADEALATRLGFVNGRVPDARVTARRVEGGQALQADSTDAMGEASLPGLLPGTWAISVLRPLTDAERAVLDSADQDVTGFGGAGQVAVTLAANTTTLEIAAGRSGTLVISEAYLPSPLITSITGTNYLLGQYIEVHNNSFQTIYLDGKIIASVRWREDPEGIWTRNFWAFPGTGTTFPLQPGGSAVVAVDAIDHRVIHPTLQDLSGANFEFLGANDVDNPAVPNMVRFAGWSDFGDAVTGHGPTWALDFSVFLADPFDPDSLPRDNLPVASPLHLRVPRDRILDVVTSGLTPQAQFGSPYCSAFVHPSFDALYAELIDGSTELGMSRQLVGGTQRQRTRTSAADFVRAPPSPGRVP